VKLNSMVVLTGSLFMHWFIHTDTCHVKHMVNPKLW